jgi:hypothetical protein
MENKLSKFISHQTCMTVCCVDELNKPYCFNSFYVFDEQNNCLLYKSASNTMHSIFLRKNNQVSGTILPDKLNKLSIQGIQFSGEYILDTEMNLNSEKYYKKYPISKMVNGNIECIRLHYIKMTDSILGITKKIFWENEIREELLNKTF